MNSLLTVDTAEMNYMQDCVICYDEIEEGEIRDVGNFLVGTSFDLHCIVKWFEERWGGNTDCPMCRRKYNLIRVSEELLVDYWDEDRNWDVLRPLANS